MNKDSVYIVIPAWNDAKPLRHVIRDLQKEGYENIIVVDDGSTDNTYEVALNNNVYALRHSINRGQGAALQTGIRFALEKGAQYIVTFDADGQMRTEDLPAMLEPVVSGKFDITLGSRFLKKTKIPLAKKILLKCSVLILRFFYGVKMTDAHNGFRVFSRNAAEKIEITSDRMEHASEIVEKIKKYNIKYKEVPVVTRYIGIRKGHGNYFQALIILWRMIFKKLLD